MINSELNLSLDVRNGQYLLRQINTDVKLTSEQLTALKNLQLQDGVYVFTPDEWQMFPCEYEFVRLSRCRILLASSAYTLDEPAQATTVPPLGIWRLGVHLSKSIPGLDVLVCDPNLSGRGTFIHLIQHENFDFVGLSVVPANLSSDLEIATLIKQYLPNAVLVIGGIDSSSLIRGDGQNTLQADFLVVGAGEQPFTELITGFIGNTVDISQLKVCGRTILHNTRRQLPTPVQMNMLPFGVGDVVHARGYTSRVYYHKFSNACPEKCFWCVSPKDGISIKDPKVAVDHLETALVYGWHSDISIVDNNLATHQRYMSNLCAEMSERPMLKSVPKHGKATINGMTQSLLRSLALAGFVRIAYGVESFDLSVRQGLGKTYRDDVIDQVLCDTVSHGIQPEINLILCSPFETMSTLSHTLADLAYWVEERNCLVQATLGLYCTIASRGHPDNVQVLKKQVSNNQEVPWIFRPGSEVYDLFFTALDIYKSRIKAVEGGLGGELSNHLKSLMKCQVLAELIGHSSSGTFIKIQDVQSSLKYVHV